MGAADLTASEISFSKDECLRIQDILRPCIFSQDDEVTFDFEKANEAALEEKYHELGHMINSYSDKMKHRAAIEEAETEATTMGLPIWGNWCGPGHGGGEAKDLLDAGCQMHDLCYKNKGYFSCQCDGDLVDHIEAHYDEMTAGEKLMALVIKVYFKYTFCISDESTAPI